MNKKTIVLTLLFRTICMSQHPEHVEIFFEVIGTDGIMFTATAGVPTFLPIADPNSDIPPEILGADTISICVSPEEKIGFNFLLAGSDPPDDYPVMRYGVYKMINELDPSYFYYDTRDCNYYINSDENGAVHCSPDVTFRYTVGVGFIGWYGGSPDPLQIPHTIQSGDTVLLSEVLDENLTSDYWGNDFSCFEADITIINDFGGVNIGDIIYIADEPINSGIINTLLRGKTINCTSKEIIAFSGSDRFHHRWGPPIGYDDNYLLSVTHKPDGDLTVINDFMFKFIAVVSTSTNLAVPISIKDPWYVDNGGNQLNTFHELTSSDYAVFIEEGDTSIVATWKYSISVPAYEVQTANGLYVFNGWAVSGAILAPDPADSSNDLVRKVFFTSETPAITARYLNLNALEGTVYIDQEWDSDITITDNVTVASEAEVTIASGTEITIPQYKRINVYGELSADGVTFTRSDPNNTDRQYWYGIYAKAGSRVYLTDCMLEGAYYSLYATDADARVFYSTFYRNYIGAYFYNCDTYYSHDNIFEDNTCGVYMYNSSIPWDDNQFIDNTYGIYASSSTGDITDNAFSGNSTSGLHCVGSASIALTDWQRIDIMHENNIIENNGSYGVYIASSATPNLGTYQEDALKINYFYGGMNRFNRGSSGHDIYSLNSSAIKAEANWWDTRVLNGSIDYLPDASGLEGGILSKILTGDDQYMDSDSMEKSLVKADLLVLDSSYTEAVGIYRQVIDSDPVGDWSLTALGRIIYTCKKAQLDTNNKQVDDEYLLSRLDEVYHSYSDCAVGKRAYQTSIPVMVVLGDVPSALERSQNVVDFYSDGQGTNEELARALFDQALLIEHFGFDGLGKSSAQQATANYQRIINDFPETEVANEVTILQKTGITTPPEAEAEIPTKFILYPAYPNPFNPSTTISYSLPEQSKVSISVYNVRGGLVNILVSKTEEAGYHQVVWKGDNNTGKMVSAGVYLYQIVTPGFTATKKIVLLK
ncbi:MAG: right-handed parallel beta-helix repeat-containing protein [Candidatus Neomarinimicrobiota bacterium]